MKTAAAFAAGAALGVVVVALIRRPTDGRCCNLLRDAVRGKLGPLAGVADRLGLVDLAPDVLSITGIPGGA